MIPLVRVSPGSGMRDVPLAWGRCWNFGGPFFPLAPSCCAMAVDATSLDKLGGDPEMAVCGQPPGQTWANKGIRLSYDRVKVIRDTPFPPLLRPPPSLSTTSVLPSDLIVV